MGPPGGSHSGLLMATLWFGSLAGWFAGRPASPPQTVIVENYYKLIPGGAEEWKALYTTHHYPILRELLQEGLLQSAKLYQRRFHADRPAWDYKVILLWRDWQALEESQAREDQISRRIYPDQAQHRQQEQRRWQLTERHWDDVLREIPLEER